MKVDLSFPSREEGKTVGTLTIYTLSEVELTELNEKGEVTCHDVGQQSGRRTISHPSIVLRKK